MREMKLLSISLLSKHSLPINFVLIAKNTSFLMFCRKNWTWGSMSIKTLIPQCLTLSAVCQKPVYSHFTGRKK